MSTKQSDDKGKKLSIKKATIKDLKVQSGKDKDVKGGGKTDLNLSKPASPCDAGCSSC
jgi:hypothetical protein